MDNPEELLHSLAEFVKLKPKEIPADLEQYLSYVAKTGDPVYQWSLVKALFREKLLNVITEFYETCPTVADPAPACPNVDFFNYETMKVGLVERLESFASAPFTVQRLCELLTAPRKQYSRADKFMRAVEKNMLVVSTREPGQARVGQDIDMSNGEDKSWLERQSANASGDRSVGLELAAFRYEPFGSAPGTAFFPPLKQKLDDFLETDAAVSAIAPQAGNLANLSAISPEQVASLAAISPEQVASLAATIGPEVANLAAEISPEVADLAAKISPVVANLVTDIPPEVADLAAEISPEVASLAAEIAPVVASLAAEIAPVVASLATEMSPDVARLAAEMSPLIAGANPTAGILPVDLPSGSIAEAEPQGLASTDNSRVAADSKPGLPTGQQGSETADEKMEVDEPLTETVVGVTNQGAGEKDTANQGGLDETSTNAKALDELPMDQDGDEKKSVCDDEATSMPASEVKPEIISTNPEPTGNTPATEGGSESVLLRANEEVPEKISDSKTMETTLIDKEVADMTPVNENGSVKPPTNEEGAVPIPSIQEDVKLPAKDEESEKPVTNEEETEKQQEDRRQVQSERVQSVIRETLEPPAKIARLEDPES